MVRSVDRALVLGDDHVQLGASTVAVDRSGVDGGDGVGLEPLRLPQPRTGTLVKRTSGGSGHRDSFRWADQAGCCVRSKRLPVARYIGRSPITDHRSRSRNLVAGAVANTADLAPGLSSSAPS